jgi:hypothetical protein
MVTLQNTYFIPTKASGHLACDSNAICVQKTESQVAQQHDLLVEELVSQDISIYLVCYIVKRTVLKLTNPFYHKMHYDNDKEFYCLLYSYFFS